MWITTVKDIQDVYQWDYVLPDTSVGPCKPYTIINKSIKYAIFLRAL